MNPITDSFPSIRRVKPACDPPIMQQSYLGVDRQTDSTHYYMPYHFYPSTPGNRGGSFPPSGTPYTSNQYAEPRGGGYGGVIGSVVADDSIWTSLSYADVDFPAEFIILTEQTLGGEISFSDMYANRLAGLGSYPAFPVYNDMYYGIQGLTLGQDPTSLITSIRAYPNGSGGIGSGFWGMDVTLVKYRFAFPNPATNYIAIWWAFATQHGPDDPVYSSLQKFEWSASAPGPNYYTLADITKAYNNNSNCIYSVTMSPTLSVLPSTFDGITYKAYAQMCNYSFLPDYTPPLDWSFANPGFPT